MALSCPDLETLFKIQSEKVQNSQDPDHNVCDLKMAAICPDFLLLGFLILDPIIKSDHFLTNLFWINQNLDEYQIQIPTSTNFQENC